MFRIIAYNHYRDEGCVAINNMSSPHRAIGVCVGGWMDGGREWDGWIFNITAVKVISIVQDLFLQCCIAGSQQ